MLLGLSSVQVILFVHTWLDVRDYCRLDTSLTNSHQREVFKFIVRHYHFKINDKKDYFYVFKLFSCYKWLVENSVLFDEFWFSNYLDLNLSPNGNRLNEFNSLDYTVKSLKTINCHNLICDASFCLHSLLKKAVNLTKLDLSNSESEAFNDLVATVGNVCAQLTDVSFVYLGGLTDETITGMKCALLKRVILNNCYQLTDKSISHIAELSGSNLEEISIDECSEVTDGSFDALSLHCASLTSVSFGRCENVTSSGLKNLMSKCQLVRLNAPQTSPELLNDVLLTHLESVPPTLTYLNVSQHMIGNFMMYYDAQLLSRLFDSSGVCSKLTTVVLHDLLLDNHSVYAICCGLVSWQ